MAWRVCYLFDHLDISCGNGLFNKEIIKTILKFAPSPFSVFLVPHAPIYETEAMMHVTKVNPKCTIFHATVEI